MKKILIAHILLILAVSCGHSSGKETRAEQPVTSEITVMSYNMLFEHFVPEQAERQWASRLPNLTSTISRLRPDIIGSQELLSWQVADFCRETGYKRIGKSLSGSVSDTDGRENECIFYNPERIKCLESGNFWFNSHPETPGPADGTTYNRMCTWGRFVVLDSGRSFYLFNSHFYYETVTFREQCACVLVNKIPSIAPAGVPTILTGDFNADLDESSIMTILNAGFLESRTEVAEPQGPSGSYYGFDFSKSPSALLDHIFITTGITVESYMVDDTQFKTGKIESDHLPVFVKLSF